MLFGVVPFGMIYGVLAQAAGLPAGVAQAMSVIVFAGSAQFVAVQLLGAGAPGAVILLTTLVINLRHVLYSASLAPHLRRLHPLWKWLLAYLLVDEVYAVSIARFSKDTETPPALANAHWHGLGAGLTLWLTWQISTAVGLYLGAQVPPGWSLEFTLALTFIALVVPTLIDRAGIGAAAAAGAVATLALGLPLKLGLAAASAVGIVVGLILETPARRS